MREPREPIMVPELQIAPDVGAQKTERTAPMSLKLITIALAKAREARQFATLGPCTRSPYTCQPTHPSPEL